MAENQNRAVASTTRLLSAVASHSPAHSGCAQPATIDVTFLMLCRGHLSRTPALLCEHRIYLSVGRDNTLRVLGFALASGHRLDISSEMRRLRLGQRHRIVTTQKSPLAPLQLRLRYGCAQC